MLITATEAAQLTAKSNSAIEQHLKRFDQKIRVAAEAGKDSIDLEVGDNIIMPMVMQRMKDAGYQTEQVHSQGIRIKWGCKP